MFVDDNPLSLSAPTSAGSVFVQSCMTALSARPPISARANPEARRERTDPIAVVQPSRVKASKITGGCDDGEKLTVLRKVDKGNFTPPRAARNPLLTAAIPSSSGISGSRASSYDFSERTNAGMSGALNKAVPATSTSTPAALAAKAVSVLMPPSIEIR